MNVLAILVAVALLAGVIGAVGSHLGWWADTDGDNVPDALEDLIEEAKAEVAAKAKKVKKVTDEIGDVVEEVKDVVSAIKGKPTKSKLNSLTKAQLVDAAKKEFDTDIDVSLKKSNIVNKVYTLYNKQ